MNIVYEDLYTSKVDVKCFTSNGVVKGNNELVMGAGTAKIVKDMYPDLPAYFGSVLVNQFTKNNGVYKYGFLFHGVTKIAALQTKFHFKDNSSVELITYSLGKLSVFANANKGKLIGIPIPGIGLGNLDYKEVEYLLQGLPPNILIFGIK